MELHSLLGFSTTELLGMKKLTVSVKLSS